MLFGVKLPDNVAEGGVTAGIGLVTLFIRLALLKMTQVVKEQPTELETNREDSR